MKKRAVFAFLIVIMLILSGCAKEEPHGTPLAPAMCEFDGFGAVYELANLIVSDEELGAFLEENGYADTGITTREQVDCCISLIERAPIPKIDENEPKLITAYPDDDWMQVNYEFRGDVVFRYYLKNAPDNGPVAGDVAFRLEENTEYNNSRKLCFKGEIHGIPAEVIIPEMKKEEAQRFFDELEFFTIPELRDHYAETYGNETEINDPGPPMICEINGIDAYLEFLEIADKTREEQELFLEEKGYAANLIWVSDIDNIIALVERAPIPLIDNCIVNRIEVYPDDTWMNVHYKLNNGMEFSYSLKNAEERGLKSEDIHIEFIEERIYGRNDVSFFSVEIDGIPVEITTQKMDAEDAQKFFETVRFLRAEELQLRG